MNAIAQPNGSRPSASTMKEALAKYEPQAQAIKETATAAVLATCMDKVFKDFGSCAFKKYRDDVLAAAGQPTDPIEVMLIEQLLVAHHRLGSLHAEAAGAKTTEATAVFNAAAVRLMAEFRKTSLALREYRTPVVPKQVTVVKQQNLAAGDQQIAYFNGKAPVRPGPATNRDNELGSNGREAIAHEPQTVLVSEPQKDGSWVAESVPARTIDGAGPRAAAAGSVREPALGAVHRPENGGG